MFFKKKNPKNNTSHAQITLSGKLARDNYQQWSTWQAIEQLAATIFFRNTLSPPPPKLSTHAYAACRVVPADPLGQPTTLEISSTKINKQALPAQCSESDHQGAASPAKLKQETGLIKPVLD